MQSQIIVICVILIVANAQSDFNEICSSFSGRRIYLDQNGSGYIQAANITASNLQNVRLNFIVFNLSLYRIFKVPINQIKWFRKQKLLIQ